MLFFLASALVLAVVIGIVVLFFNYPIRKAYRKITTYINRSFEKKE